MPETKIDSAVASNLSNVMKDFAVPSMTTDAATGVIEGWVKSDGRSLPEWFVGKSLHAGDARVSTASFDLIPVQLRGF